MIDLVFIICCEFWKIFMRLFFLCVAVFATLHTAYAEELISSEDARTVLNMSQSSWNSQVKAAAKAGLSSSQETYGGTLKQLIKGPDWEMSTYPLYGGVTSAPSTVEIKISYNKKNPLYNLPTSSQEATCAKVSAQLKVEFSFLCAFMKTNEHLHYTFLISKPGSRKDIDTLNQKGIYSFDQQKMESNAAAAAKKLIPNYWAQLDAWAENRVATKEELIVAATKDLPMICNKLVTGYALASGKSPNTSGEDREEWNFNSDFCVKATVHRRFPQPEFENPKILDAICYKQKDYEFNYNLCKRAGVFR